MKNTSIDSDNQPENHSANDQTDKDITDKDTERRPQIWVDADACPVVIRETLFRAAERTETILTLIANQYIPIPASKWISMRQVASGFDVADDEIVRLLQAGDLVITGDIPLAAEAIEKGALVLTSRGEKHTKENIKARLTMRDFMETMRASGIQSGGPAALNQRDRMNFANKLDQWLAKQTRA